MADIIYNFIFYNFYTNHLDFYNIVRIHSFSNTFQKYTWFFNSFCKIYAVYYKFMLFIIFTSDKKMIRI